MTSGLKDIAAGAINSFVEIIDADVFLAASSASPILLEYRNSFLGVMVEWSGGLGADSICYGEFKPFRGFDKSRGLLVFLWSDFDFCLIQVGRIDSIRSKRIFFYICYLILLESYWPDSNC